MSIGAYLTREFTPKCYEDEISSIINGNPIFPPGYLEEDFNKYRIIQIHVSAAGLKNSAFFANYDPFCVLNLMGPRGFKEYARTEVCWNMPSPLWVRPFTYVIKNEPEILFFEIYSVHNQCHSLKRQQAIGSCQIDVVDLLKSSKHSLKLDIMAPDSDKTTGVLSVTYIDMKPCVGALYLRVSCSKIISSKRTLKSANPFFMILRHCPFSNEFIPVFKSAVRSKTHAADWEVVELPMQFLCGGDLDNPIQLRVYDYFPSSEDSLIGFFVTTPRLLIEKKVSTFDLRDESGGKSHGIFRIEFIENFSRPRLYDFRLKGVQMCAMLAVDFSSTPVDIVYSNRLQHTDSGVFSYRSAINDVCDSLHPLTLGQPYYAFGFADFPDKKLIPITLSTERNSVPTVKTLLQAYGTVKESSLFPDRASLSPVFLKAREIAYQKWNEERTITTLVVITNGKFTDLDQAITTLAESEDAPFSTVMILMGGARRDIDHAFKKKGGFVYAEGIVPRRPMISVLTYNEDMIYPDNKLPLKMVPLAKRMARNWLEMSNYNPWDGNSQLGSVNGSSTLSSPPLKPLYDFD